MTVKHDVHTDALDTLGSIIGDAEQRDAIHLAVEPMVAVEMLRPGQDVGLLPGGAGASDQPVGIVDPFLKRAVMPGEKFWLIVYPRQIRSLRHVWTHPAFDDVAVAAKPAVSASEQWIRNFADRFPVHYETLMEGARDWVASQQRGGWGEYLSLGGLFEGESVPDEFWPHYEAVTGERVSPDHRGSFFTCSC